MYARFGFGEQTIIFFQVPSWELPLGSEPNSLLGTFYHLAQFDAYGGEPPPTKALLTPPDSTLQPISA